MGLFVSQTALPRNFQSLPALRKALPDALAQLARDLERAAPSGQLQALCDTRALHNRLFAPLLPDALRHAAGTYRGTPGTELEQLERAVFISRKAPGLRNQHQCLPAQEVALAMEDLAVTLEKIWQAGQPPPDLAYAHLAEVTHAFLSIHPYMDGNGHIYRLVLPVLGRHLGLRARAEWTLHPRPYDHTLSLCLQWYPHHPALLACYLRQWFDPAHRK